MAAQGYPHGAQDRPHDGPSLEAVRLPDAHPPLDAHGLLAMRTRLYNAALWVSAGLASVPFLHALIHSVFAMFGVPCP